MSQKISEMVSATTLDGTELVPVVQTTNKKSTVELLRGWASLGATANAILRTLGTDGESIQVSPVTIDDLGNITLGILGSTAGASRIIQPEGSSADIGLIFTPKGNGNFSVSGNRIILLAASDVSLGGDYIAIVNNTSSLPGEIRIYEAADNGSNYTAFKTAAQSASINYTLPTAAPTSDGQSLVGTTGGVLSWDNPDGVVLTAQVTITSAQILSSNTTPVQIVAAPGAGKIINLIRATTKLVYNSVAYATNVTSFLVLGTSASNFVTSGINMIGGTATKWSMFDASSTLSFTTNLENEELNFMTNVGDPTAGNSDMIVTVYYTIVDYN